MLELLPYDDSDKSEFSQEGFHSYMSKLNDEIIEERRIEEPPEPELPNQTLTEIQQTLGQVAVQLKGLQSSVTGISRIVQQHGEILNSHRATDQSRVKDRSIEPDPKYTSLHICLGGEREPALDRSIVLTPLDRIFDQVMGLAFLKGDELRPEVRSFQDLIKLGNDDILQNLIISPGETEDRRFPSIINEGGLQFKPPEQNSICYIEPGLADFSSFDQTRHMSENVSIFLNSLQEVSIVNGKLVRGADSSGSILRGHCAYLKAAAYLKAQVVPASSEDSFGLEEHLRKAATASSGVPACVMTTTTAAVAATAAAAAAAAATTDRPTDPENKCQELPGGLGVARRLPKYAPIGPGRISQTQTPMLDFTH